MLKWLFRGLAGVHDSMLQFNTLPGQEGWWHSLDAQFDNHNFALDGIPSCPVTQFGSCCYHISGILLVDAWSIFIA
jgi:hypothetical protein